MSTRQTTNGMARHLLAANEQELERLAPALVDRVAERLGAPAPPVDHHWPVDIVAATREFLTCVAMDDVARIAEPEGIFEQVGAESARGGLPFEHLAAGIREAVRRTQTQVHRAVIAEGLTEDTEAVLGLLTRVVTAGEAVVEAARHGHEIVRSRPRRPRPAARHGPHRRTAAGSGADRSVGVEGWRSRLCRPGPGRGGGPGAPRRRSTGAVLPTG